MYSKKLNNYIMNNWIRLILHFVQNLGQHPLL